LILANEKDEQGYIPCIAVENEPGYYRTDWRWGHDFEIAELIAQRRNERMGISEKDAIRIIGSTIRGEVNDTQ
jgi:hypothetical protein